MLTIYADPRNMLTRLTTYIPGPELRKARDRLYVFLFSTIRTMNHRIAARMWKSQQRELGFHDDPGSWIVGGVVW
jgi:hypothetical protein